MPARSPPASVELGPLTWSLPGDRLRLVGKARLSECDARLEALLRVGETPTIAGFLTPLDRLLLEVRDLGSHGHFVFNVDPDADARSAGRELSEAADRFYNAFRLNPTIYERLGALDLSGADRVTQRTVEKMRKEMRRAGVEKGPEERERLRVLSDQIDSVSNRFIQNIAEATRTVEVTDRGELAGLPEDFVKAHPPGPDGRIRITTQYPDYNPVQSYADRSEIRRRLMFEFMNRAAPENLDVLRELIEKRREFAERLGYPAFSALAVEDKMMETRENARKFLGEVVAVLRPGSEADQARLLRRKQRDRPAERSLDLWDDAYFRNKLRNEEYGVDARALRAYLPYGPVRDGLFGLCRRLFDLEFRPLGSDGLWHPSVEAYDVLEHGTRIGRIFLDMVPREGKFSHAACFGVRSGIAGVQGPQSALVCNFVDPTSPKETARMEYRDVVTFFHEFGHLLHSMFSGRMAWTYGHQLEWDFVEAPSLLFEEWARDPATLGQFAKDPDNGATIPSEVLKRLEAADAFGRASFWMRQVALSAIAFEYYDRPMAGVDLTELYRTLWEAHLPGRYPPEFVPEASWGHLTGYSACYYTYVWSLVIARDLLRPFREKGSLTDPELARRYAVEILSSGGSRPAAESIEAFLGRPFDLRAFESWIRESAPPAA